MKAMNSLDAVRKELLQQELDKAKWNYSAVGRKLDLSREGVRKMAIRYGLIKAVKVGAKKWRRA